MKDVRGDKPDTGMYVKMEKDNLKTRRIAAPRGVAVLDTRSLFVSGSIYVEKSVCFPSS